MNASFQHRETSCGKPAVVHVQIWGAQVRPPVGVEAKRVALGVRCSVGGSIPLAMLVAWVREPRRMRPYATLGFNACAECARELGLLW